MAKKTERTNFRVVVEPLTHIYGIRLDSVESNCRKMVEQIKRHVDGVEQVYVQFDKEVTCTHCGHRWEEEIDGKPLCCNKAVEEWEHSKNINTQQP